MTTDDDDERDRPAGALDALLLPLRLPGRVAANIQTLAGAVVSLQAVAERRLASIDDRAGTLVARLGDLQASIDHIGRRVEELESLEQTLTAHLDGLRSDLNERMIAVEHEVRAMRPSMDAMAQDVAKIDDLLPDPGDGPLRRLKDTLTSS